MGSIRKNVGILEGVGGRRGKRGRRCTNEGDGIGCNRSLTDLTQLGHMLFLSLEDLQGTQDAILFPEVYGQSRKWHSSTSQLLITGIMEMNIDRCEPSSGWKSDTSVVDNFNEREIPLHRNCLFDSRRLANKGIFCCPNFADTEIHQLFRAVH